MATNNMNNLATLIKRLEAATSRLEDMASPLPETLSTNGDSKTATPAVVGAAVPIPTPPSAAKEVPEEVPELVAGFDTFIEVAVKKYVSLSDETGGLVAEQAALVLKAFANQRKFLLVTTKAKKPDMGSTDYMTLLKPLQEGMESISDFRDNNRSSPMFNQLSTVSESISVLGWVTLDSKPYKHVEDSLGSAQYYGNRVLKEKDTKQAAWVQGYYDVFKHLTEYVKESFPHGIMWKPQGMAPLEALKAVEDGQGAPPPPNPKGAAAGGPPPPPPPGPPPKNELKEVAPAAVAAGGIGAVFSELNKGSDVTKGLKKVSPNEMTHKNPSLRAGAVVPTRSDSQSSMSSATGKSPAPGKKPKPESMRTKPPPKKELDGNKWIIENYDSESQPVKIDATLSQSILISRCNKTTIMVKGKANAISIDNSPRLSLVIESLVSSVDVIKSSNFALQVLGTLPTILMDQVDGAQIYLGKESMKTEVFSSKCSSINLNILEGEDEDYKEIALPEQIRTYIGKDGKIASEIVEHAG